MKCGSMWATIIFCAGIALFGPAHVQAGADAVLVAPSILTSSRPQYPADARTAGIEGWVHLRFSILANGAVTNIEITGETPAGLFGPAAVASLQATRFKPATREGRPIDWHNVDTPIVFSLDNSGRPSEAFAREYKEITTLIANGDYAGAETRNRLLAGKALLLSELLATEFSRAVVAAGLGHYQEALVTVRNITPGEAFLEPATFSAALKIRFQAEVALRHYGEALMTFQRLQAAQPLPADDPIVRSAAGIRTAANADGPLRIDGRIENGHWEYWPLRRVVTLVNVNGKLDKVGFLCEFKRESLDIAPDIEWRIPQSWGDCLLRVAGSNGATFTVVEFNPAVALTPATPAP